MKYSASSLRLLIALANGETIADSRLKGDLFNRLKEEKLLVAMTRGSRKSWRVQDATALMSYLNSVYGIRNPEELLRLAESGDTSRAEQVHTTGDSKFRSTRSFKGFMVSCYQPIEVTLNSKPFTLHPQEGTFTFIYDFDGFAIPEDVMVVGIENPENFRWISRQKVFFKENLSSSSPLLFVSRYPQTQHGDLIRWLKAIPNRYVHFGDLDLAGIRIYLTEYFCHLGERSSFLIPSDFDQRIASGSPDRYNDQLQFASTPLTDTRLQPLINSIHRHHRGYDQEGFIP